MGTLLRKIQSQGAAESMDLRNVSCEAISSCGKVAGKLRITNAKQSFPQNTQSLRTPQPLQGNVFHKSANPQLVTEKTKNISPDPKAKLVRLAVQSGVFEQGYLLDEKEIAALVPPTDWRDVSHCSVDELKAWAAALVPCVPCAIAARCHAAGTKWQIAPTADQYIHSLLAIAWPARGVN